MLNVFQLMTAFLVDWLITMFEPVCETEASPAATEAPVGSSSALAGQPMTSVSALPARKSRLSLEGAARFRLSVEVICNVMTSDFKSSAER